MEGILRYYGNDIQDIKLEDWFESKPKHLHSIAKKWIAAIQNIGRDVQIIFHDGYPIGCVDDAPFAYVNVFTKHANVGFFYGAELPDKKKLLIGTGKRMRHIKVDENTSIQDEDIQALIEAAYVDIKMRL